MAQMKGAVHVRVGKVPEPFGKLFVDLRRGKTCSLLPRRGIGLEDVLFFPLNLVFLFQRLQMVPLSSLLIVNNRANDAKG
jgi:hypothetical protein